MVPIPTNFIYKVWQVFTEYYITFLIISWESLPCLLSQVISNVALNFNGLLIDGGQINFKIFSIIITFKYSI
jgi:hypothetical protein